MQALEEEDFERELKLCFVQEASELLEKVERQLLAFEQNTRDPETLAALFRTAHTFKGSGLSAGYQELGNFCHSLENLLDRLRKGQIPPTPVVLDILLQAFDLVKEIVQGLQENWKSSGFEKINPAVVAKTLALLANPLEPANEKHKTTDEKHKLSANKKNTNAVVTETDQEIQLVVSQIQQIDQLRKAQASQQKAAEAANTQATAEVTPARRNTQTVYEIRNTSEPKKAETEFLSGENLAKLAKEAFTTDDLAIISQLLLLQQTGELSVKPAKKILGVLQTHPLWKETERLCIARRIGYSKQLQIFDAHTEKAPVNETLVAGYSCFVSKQTSLLKIPEHHMRIFPESENVIQSYEARKLPVQRSISKLFSKRMKSGLCAPIFSEKIATGFLFLNSRKSGYFNNLSSTSLNLIEFIKSIAQQLVLPLDPTLDSQYAGTYARSLFPERGNLLNIDELRQEIRHMFMGKISLNFDNRINKPILISQFNLAFVLRQLVGISGWIDMAEVSSTTNSLLLTIEEKNHRLVFNLSCYEDQTALQRQILISNQTDLENFVNFAKKIIYHIEKINPCEWQISTELELIEDYLENLDYSV